MSATELLVVDSLHGLVGLEPVASAALAAAPRAVTPAQALERLREWQVDFEAAQAPATLKAVRADWGQFGSHGAPLRGPSPDPPRSCTRHSAIGR